jgi:hypothetical protein
MGVDVGKMKVGEVEAAELDDRPPTKRSRASGHCLLMSFPPGRPGALAALLVAAIAPSCVSPSAKITIYFRVDQELFRPEYLLVTWVAPHERDRVGLRVPDDGLLATSGPAVGSMVIDMEGAPAGPRTIIAWGMRGVTQVSGALGQVEWVPGTRQALTVTLGCVQKAAGEQAPPETRIDRAPWVDCAEPARPSRADAGREVAPPPADDDAAVPDGPTPDAGLPLDGPLDVPAPLDAARVDRPPPLPDAPAAADGAQPADRTPLPPGADLGKGLVVHLRLDDGRGNMTARDSSGNGNTGTLQQLDLFDAWVPGYRGTGLDLAGKGWVSVPESPTLNSINDGFSIAAWVQRTGDGTIAARRAVGASGFLYRFFIAGGLLGLQINSSNGARADFLSSNQVPTGRWVQLAAVYDKHEAHVFLDGVSIGQQRYELNIGPENSPLEIGASQDATLIGAADRLLGIIDEVAVYDRPLTAGEVQALAGGNQPPGP